MSLEQHQEKDYAQDPLALYRAALAAVKKLDGQVTEDVPDRGRLVATFPKTILGKTLGERTHLTCEVRGQGGAGQVVVDAYPLDAIGRKLMFGARKGVTQTVVTLFLEHLDQQLG
ncbi:MAG: hypothetical protein JO171_15090 [Paludibacterium sp.]|uniref:hypothetical protein n=1 Tax=Paludibacterium sp. TaxID=1917523 RepID=UPI0025FF46D4|nr:hypothetical protein [Paludibacterium sp.]MBV8048477.1 hypothetical protein [Paludibacterium sp.]MBV8646575.1 hypothetical protein [Paludibacterium sp.]